MIYEHEIKRKANPVQALTSGDLTSWERWLEDVAQSANRNLEPKPMSFVPFPPHREGLAIRAKEYLESRGLSWEIALACNWYAAIWHGPRLIIPATKRSGEKWWQGRLLENLITSRASMKRWDSPAVERDDALVIIERNPEKKVLVIVEGPMDVLAAATAGFNSVGTLGAKPTDRALEHLTYVGQDYDTVFAVPDGDAIDSWTRTQMKLAIYGLEMSLEPVWAPHKDLAAMAAADRKEFLERRVEALR